MASLPEQYYALSHRLRGILTSFESVYYLTSLPNRNEPLVQDLLRLTLEKGKDEIEDFRKLLEKRAKVRDKDNQLLLAMCTTLYSQLEEGVQKEILLTEINLMADEIKRMIIYNRSMEKL